MAHHMVYIIHSTSGHYKIGHTTNVKRRLNELKKTKGPYEFSLECSWACSGKNHAVDLEKYLHNEFSRKRVNGEWFSLSVGDLIRIGEISLYAYDDRDRTFRSPIQP